MLQQRKYGGSWARSSPVAGPTVLGGAPTQIGLEPLNAELHEADPRHAVDEGDPGQWVYDVPPAAPSAPQEFEVLDVWVVNTPGLTIDQTNTTDHSYGTSPLVHTLPAAAAQLNALHNVGTGAGRSLQHQEAPFQFSDERWWAQTFESNTGEKPVSETMLRRGLNGDPINNPADDSYLGRGFRPGWVGWVGVDRKLRRPERRHDQRPIYDNTAYVDPGGPPVNTAYGTPFYALARARHRKYGTPVIRREPTPPDEAVTRDGIGEASPTVGESWVVG